MWDTVSREFYKLQCASEIIKFNHFILGFIYSKEPNLEDGAKYSVKVKINDKWLANDEPNTFCSGKCVFTVCLNLWSIIYIS